jgi:hypothetical protein
MDACVDSAMRTRSENVNGREVGLGRYAIPQVDGKTNVACPKGVTPSPELLACRPTLGNRGHGKRVPIEPDGVLGSAIKLEKRVAIAAGAMTEIGALNSGPAAT